MCSDTKNYEERRAQPRVERHRHRDTATRVCVYVACVWNADCFLSLLSSLSFLAFPTLPLSSVLAFASLHPVHSKWYVLYVLVFECSGCVCVCVCVCVCGCVCMCVWCCLNAVWMGPLALSLFLSLSHSRARALSVSLNHTHTHTHTLSLTHSALSLLLSLSSSHKSTTSLISAKDWRNWQVSFVTFGTKERERERERKRERNEKKNMPHSTLCQ